MTGSSFVAIMTVLAFLAPAVFAEEILRVSGTGAAVGGMQLLALLRCLLERPPRNRISARGLHRGPAGGRAVRSSATRQSLACGPPEIVGAPHPPRLRGRSAETPRTVTPVVG